MQTVWLPKQLCCHQSTAQKHGRHMLSKRQRLVSTQALFGKKPPEGGQRSCSMCKNKGSVTCPGCKGTGKNKKNGNVFERYKCYDCQGFGLVTCPKCGRGGLTPEQRGER